MTYCVLKYTRKRNCTFPDGWENIQKKLILAGHYISLTAIYNSDVTRLRYSWWTFHCFSNRTVVMLINVLYNYKDCLSNLNINIPSKLYLSFTCCALILLFYLFVDVCFDMVDIDHQLYGGIQNRLWVGFLHFKF